MEEVTPAPPPHAHGFRLGLLRFSAVELLGSLVLLFVVAPFLEGIRWGDLIEALLVTLVLLAAVLAVGGRRRALIATAILVTPALIGKWGHHIWPRQFPQAVGLAFGAAFIAFIVVISCASSCARDA